MSAVVAAVLAVSVLTQQTPYDSVFDQLKRLAPRADAVAQVKNVVLHRDVMELRLESGYAYLLTPLSGRTIGIAFVGSGALNFEPPLIVEQYNLRRVFGDTSISGPVTAAVLVFADSTADELKRQLTFGPGTAARGDAEGAVNATLDYLIDERNHSVTNWSLMNSLLNKSTTGYFAAYIKRARGETVMIEYDPMQVEEVSLYRRGKMQGQRVETVCQFERAEDLTREVPSTEEHDAVVVKSYEIDASIDKGYKFAARTGMKFVVGYDGQQWIPFYLYPELEIDSLASSTGTPLVYYRRDKQWDFWIRLPQPAKAGDTVNIRLAYHGNLIGFGSAIEEFLPPATERRNDLMGALDSWSYIKGPSQWYPRHQAQQHARFLMTFRTPKNLQFAMTGRLVDSSTTGEIMTTRWETERPARNVSFNIGKFKQLDIRDPRIPPVTVLVNSEAHSTISRFFLSARRPEEFVGADIANSLAFFTRMFGPPLFSQYHATEIPYYHGEAFPGLIHLSWTTFLGLRTDGSDEIFRAHEMAHQWWGIGVYPTSYRDAWISEGFSTFAGMWYMQSVLRDNDKYLTALREAREEIRRERNNAAPIGLGRRASESYRGNYALSSYQKGAWVVHMLRNMMINTRTMDESRFEAMMRDFYITYRGKTASTTDFQRTVEKHFGQPMDWFFNQWVYGTAVPTYTLSWNAETDSTGKPAVRLRVRQSDVPPGFAMYVPVQVRFEEGEAMFRMLVRGEETEALVRLPAPPRSVKLNPLESVLAEVKTEAWSDQ